MAASVWIDRVVENLSPAWALRRQRVRIASAYLARNYEGATIGRRTQGWHRGMTDEDRTH